MIRCCLKRRTHLSSPSVIGTSGPLTFFLHRGEPRRRPLPHKSLPDRFVRKRATIRLVRMTEANANRCVRRLRATFILTTIVSLLGISCVSAMTCVRVIPLHHRPCLQVVREMSKVVDKLRSIHQLTLRKHRIKERLADVRTRVAASRCGGGGLSKPTSSKHTRLRPAWVLKRGGVSYLDDPVTAIEFLLSSAQIAMK